MTVLAQRLKNLSTVNASGCWIWSLAVQRGGYGVISVKDKSYLAHRVAYECFTGPIPVGLTIDHLCRVRNCINPAHLEAVTHRVNVLRGQTVVAANAAKTHCPCGASIRSGQHLHSPEVRAERLPHLPPGAKE